MVIKILGSGCPNCKRLEQLAQEAAKEIGVNAAFEKVQDIQKIMSYGVMSTPALVIDEKVKVYGRVPSKDVIKKYIEEEI
ncbi:MAG: thioredoxin family protein [Clostridiales bacterium]|jgi:small redox-active disulfide protein 2|nr:thioredoxin family protein [Eubacteriales bacterium]MDH7567470.1 thioredoxin family protein [Clostridiales bacterium]